MGLYFYFYLRYFNKVWYGRVWYGSMVMLKLNRYKFIPVQ